MTHFASPHILWLLLALVPMVGGYIYRQRRGGATIRISTIGAMSEAPRTVRYWLRHVPFVLRCVAIALVIIALARPQDVEHHSQTTSEGIDIVLAIDVSGTMLARDLKPDRITVAREAAGNFIVDRRGDRIGIVVFAGEAYTQSPLTTDQTTLLTMLGQVESGLIEDGTAIGTGLATALNRLRESEAKSKVVILLTDGVNNRTTIAPLTAAEIAKKLGVKVYTIGIGTRGTAPYPVQDMWGNISYQQMPVEIDEQTLREIAEMTGGEYFRATDKGTLAEVYERINQLEKSEVEVTEFTTYDERFLVYLLAALAALVLEFVIGQLWLKRIP
ncbi:MAG: VWA domain-containing protein [Rikenellaceae bacterium]|nr:VWA domain-containing protein [Rikenellaceae bacterium]